MIVLRPAALALALSAAVVAQSGSLVVSGTTAGQPMARLPSFGSTPSNCVLEPDSEPYDASGFFVETDANFSVSVTEPVTSGDGLDDTVLIVYRGTFDPADACRNLVGIGNDPAGSGLTVSLDDAETYMLVVGGFLGVEDDFTLEITGPSTPVDGEEAPSDELRLGPARPNPTTGTAVLSLTLVETGAVRAELYDALGRHVGTVADQTFSPGTHDLRVEAESLPTGVYAVRISVGSTVLTAPLTVVR